MRGILQWNTLCYPVANILMRLIGLQVLASSESSFGAFCPTRWSAFSVVCRPAASRGGHPARRDRTRGAMGAALTTDGSPPTHCTTTSSPSISSHPGQPFDARATTASTANLPSTPRTVLQPSWSSTIWCQRSSARILIGDYRCGHASLSRCRCRHCRSAWTQT